MTRARELSRLSNTNALIVDTNSNIGIGSTIPKSKLDVAGIVSATSYYGSGANLTGISSVSFATTSYNLIGIASTATAAGTAYGLTGSPNITVGNITGSGATFNNNLNVGTAITMYSATGIISATKYYGDGSGLSGIDATRIVSGLSSVTVATSSTISAYVNGSNIFNVTGTGVTMTSGKRLDISSFTETVQTLGSSGSAISGSNALDIGTYSTFIAYVGTSAVTFTLTGGVNGRLSSWTLILIYTNSGTRSITFSFGTLRYPGGSSSITLSNTQVHDVLSFFTADNATNTYASIIGLGFAT